MATAGLAGGGDASRGEHGAAKDKSRRARGLEPVGDRSHPRGAPVATTRYGLKLASSRDLTLARTAISFQGARHDPHRGEPRERHRLPRCRLPLEPSSASIDAKGVSHGEVDLHRDRARGLLVELERAGAVVQGWRLRRLSLRGCVLLRAARRQRRNLRLHEEQHVLYRELGSRRRLSHLRGNDLVQLATRSPERPEDDEQRGACDEESGRHGLVPGSGPNFARSASSATLSASESKSARRSARGLLPAARRR